MAAGPEVDRKLSPVRAASVPDRLQFRDTAMQRFEPADLAAMPYKRIWLLPV